jgi:adenylyl-sulfate kinase
MLWRIFARPRDRPSDRSGRVEGLLIMNAISKVFWLFGRSGAGKTTLALRLREGLLSQQIPVVYFDGDEMRATLCSDLGFQSEARLENHRRIAEIARMLARQNLTVVVSTMAPEYQHRDLVSQIVGERLVWFYIDAPLAVCVARDPKGIYKRAQAGQLRQLLDYPFGEPRPQEKGHHVDTVAHNEDECYQQVLEAARRQLGRG